MQPEPARVTELTASAALPSGQDAAAQLNYELLNGVDQMAWAFEAEAAALAVALPPTRLPPMWSRLLTVPFQVLKWTRSRR